MKKTAFLPMIALALGIGIAATPAIAGSGSGGNSFASGLNEFVNCLIQTTPRQAR